MRIGKIFNYHKLKFLIEQSLPKKYEQKIILGAKQKEKIVQTVEYCEKTKRRQKKEMKD